MSSKILIVEDDFANQQVASLFIKKFGYPFEVAENGQIAVNKAMQTHFGLILMDCQMPIMDGFEATKKIRNAKGPNQDTPIIALTANIVNGIEKECIKIGMNDLLNKPVSMNTMKDMIEKWLI
jgi:CheY-like chemotaxis protein